MKVIFLIIFFVASGAAQEKYIATAIIFGAVSGYTSALKIDERQKYKEGKEYQSLNKSWHTWRMIELGSAIVLGITIAEWSKFDIVKILKATFLSGVIFWIMHDAVYNNYFDRNILYVSEQSYSELEKYGHLKLPVLGVAILINLL